MVFGMDTEQIATTLESLAIRMHEAVTPDETVALQSAVQTLRSTSRARPPAPAAAGNRWDDGEDSQLCYEFDAGLSVAEIAVAHGRTRSAIHLRLLKLGRMTSAEVGPRGQLLTAR